MNPLKVAGITAAGITVAALTIAPQARAATGHTATGAASALPPFTLVSHGGTLDILRTGTHTQTGSLKAPSSAVEFSGAASDGTADGFLLSVQTPGAPNCDAWFYRITLSPAGKPSALKLLHSVPGRLPTSMAASPGGGMIAYSTVNCAPASPVGSITAVTRTGTRSWTYSLLTQDYPPTLSATASGGSLAFPQYTGTTPDFEAGLVLNTASKPGPVSGASKIVLRNDSPDAIVISPDGKTLYAHTSSGTKNEVAAYNASTGKLIKVVYSWTNTNSRMHCYLSADATGKYLLVDIVTPTSSVASNTLIGYNMSTGAIVKLPAQTSAWLEGTQITW